MDQIQERKDLTDSLSKLFEAPSAQLAIKIEPEVALVRQLGLFEELLKRGEIGLLKTIVEKMVNRRAIACKALMRFILLVAQSDFDWAYDIVKTLLVAKDGLLSLSRHEE